MNLSVNIDLPSVTPPTPKGRRRELLTPLPQEGHFLLVLDNSALEHFTKCPTSAMHYLVFHREAYARNAALTFGGALHAGIEVLLRGGDNHRQDQAIYQYFEENPAPPDEYRTNSLAVLVLRHYRIRQEFPDYDWNILSDTEPIIERPFEIPLGVIEITPTMVALPEWSEPRYVHTIHVAWSGRIDLVAAAHGKTRVVDHKTTSIAGDQYIPAFLLSNQTIGYVWAARQLWPDLDVSGFCLNAIYIRKPGEGVTNLTAKGPRGGPAPLDFFRAYFDYSEERVDQWETNAMVIVEDFIRCLTRRFFPMFTNSCFNKYGRCQYHDVCSIDQPVVRHRMLMSEAFKEVTWNPTH
jgi:hypothetical protein